MENSNSKWLPVATFAAALVIIVLLLVGGNQSASGLFGGASCNSGNCTDFDAVNTSAGYYVDDVSVITGTGGLKIGGSDATTINQLNAGTCYIRPYAATITASSTAKVDCQGTAAWNASGVSALTGVTAGDWVQAKLATSTAGTTSNGLVITGASASTTPGFIELYISNLTGGTFTWPTSGTASGTASYLSGN